MYAADGDVGAGGDDGLRQQTVRIDLEALGARRR